MNDPHLTYFGDHEFVRDGVQWMPLMASDLLVKLDVWRHMIGRKVRVSPHPRAIGRKDGDSQSTHNIEFWGKVLGIDVIPEYVKDQDDAWELYDIAFRVGFTGIGFYPHWRDENGDYVSGYHLDVRRSRRPGDSANWGFVRRGSEVVQVSVNNAIERLS